MQAAGPPQQPEARPASAPPRGWTLALGGLGLIAAVPGLLALARIWSTVDYYAHGFLVPAVSWWALHRDRDRWSGIPPRGDRRGVATLVLALLGYVAGLAAGLPWLIGLSLVAALAAAVLVAAGAAVLRAVAFPVGFLIFMSPLPEPVLGPVIRELQVLVSEVASGLLAVAGLPVERAGNVLVLPTGEELFVAEACSGVTSLITLMPLGVLLAYFTQKRLSARLLLVSAVVPLALFFNLVRVMGTVWLSLRIGAERATSGLLHEGYGLAVYVVGCLALLGVGRALERIGVGR